MTGVEERLALAEKYSNAERLNYEEDTDGSNVVEALKNRTGGRGPDVCIDAVGMEAYGHGAGAIVDYARTLLRMDSDRPNALRQAILSCRKGGTVSVPGVYGGMNDSLPFGAAFAKGFEIRNGSNPRASLPAETLGVHRKRDRSILALSSPTRLL